MTKSEYKKIRIAEIGDYYRSHSTSKSNSDKQIAMECGEWPVFKGNTSYERTLKLLLECKHTEQQIIASLNDEFPGNKNDKRPKTVMSSFSSGKCKNVSVVRENGIIGLRWDRYKFFSKSGEWKDNTIENQKFQFHQQLKKSQNDTKIDREERLKNAELLPRSSIVESTYFHRNPDVVVEVLLRANGTCERCSKKAPFKRAKDGTPYLEVHHKVQLAHGGEDTVENALALCPNCHRYLHSGQHST